MKMNQSQSSRDRIIETASRLFQRQGYHGTGLNQIIKESGAPKGSLYYHFPNGKEQLAIESVQATADFVSKKIERGLQQKSNPIEAIQSLIQQFADEFRDDSFSGGVPIATVALETSLLSPELRGACQSAYERFEHIFFEKLQAGGYEDEHAKALSILINTMIEGAFIKSFTMGNTHALKIVANQIPVLLK